MNWWILVHSGFIGSFHLPWSEWSRITDPDPDYPKGTHHKTILDSRFHAMDSSPETVFRILCQWNLDYGFQSLVGFRIPWAKFRIPTSRILDSPVSGIWITFMSAAIRPPRFHFPIVPCSLSLVTLQKQFRCVKLLIARLLPQFYLKYRPLIACIFAPWCFTPIIK